MSFHRWWQSSWSLNRGLHSTYSTYRAISTRVCLCYSVSIRGWISLTLSVYILRYIGMHCSCSYSHFESYFQDWYTKVYSPHLLNRLVVSLLECASLFSVVRWCSLIWMFLMSILPRGCWFFRMYWDWVSPIFCQNLIQYLSIHSVEKKIWRAPTNRLSSRPNNQEPTQCTGAKCFSLMR